MKISTNSAIIAAVLLSVSSSTFCVLEQKNLEAGSGVGAVVAGLIAGGIIKTGLETDAGQKTLNTLGFSKEEADVIVPILSGLAVGGIMGSPELKYLAKWGILATGVSKLLYSDIGMKVLHNVPFFGEYFVSKKYIARIENEEISNQERAERLTQTLAAIAIFRSLQRYLGA